MDRKIKHIMVIILVCILSGCSMIQSPKDLMKRPKSYVQEQEMDGILSKFLTYEKTLTLAINQMDKESIRKVDLDGDHIDELLLLYKESENLYGVMILKEKNKLWHRINSVKGSGKGIHLVEYKDITGDEKPELFIGWKGLEENSLDIYSSHEGYFDLIKTTSYIDFDIKDLDEDGKKEFILLQSLEGENRKILEVLKYENRSFISMDQFMLQNENMEAKITFRKANKNQKEIIIDFIDEYDTHTDLFILKNNQLIKKEQ